MVSSGRQPNGTFAPGNKIGKGRPGNQVARLEKLESVVTMDDWGKICDVAKRQALKGNRYARDWLSKYLLPPQLQDSEAIADALLDATEERKALRSDPLFMEFQRWKLSRAGVNKN